MRCMVLMTDMMGYDQVWYDICMIYEKIRYMWCDRIGYILSLPSRDSLHSSTWQSDRRLCGQSVLYGTSSDEVHYIADATEVTRQTSVKRTWVRISSSRGSSMTNLRLALGTDRNYWRTRQIHQSWERGSALLNYINRSILTVFVRNAGPKRPVTNIFILRITKCATTASEFNLLLCLEK
jgi:hypothetical protein